MLHISFIFIHKIELIYATSLTERIVHDLISFLYV